MAARRVNWWVRWLRGARAWRVYRGRQPFYGFDFSTKARARLFAVSAIEQLRQRDKTLLAELLILDKMGRIRERRTYGADPKRSKG